MSDEYIFTHGVGFAIVKYALVNGQTWISADVFFADYNGSMAKWKINILFCLFPPHGDTYCISNEMRVSGIQSWVSYTKCT